ncbi:MAG: hypothetical protein ABGX72_06690 [Methyloprofundus sp.]
MPSLDQTLPIQRALASTLLNEQGWHSDAIERQFSPLRAERRKSGL